MATEVKQPGMQELQSTSYLTNGNTYIDDLYDQYLKNPQSVSTEWRQYFASLSGTATDVPHSDVREYFQELAKRPYIANAGVGTISVEAERKQTQVIELIEAYRAYGHYEAKLDPLGMVGNRPGQDLSLARFGLSLAESKQKFNTAGLLPDVEADLKIILETLQRTYCGTIGFEYKHIGDSQQVAWLQSRIEAVQGRFACSAETKKRILEDLTAAEGLEKFLGAKYVGETRFSLEGGDSLIASLNELIRRASAQQLKEIVIGMGHRGRLNALVNILGKSPTELFDEFEGKHTEEGSGDVKYHMGFSCDLKTPDGKIHVAMAFNPSHLEIIDPVVEGSVRARQQRRGDKEYNQIMPVLIHGDAAFAGQGVVMETFAMSQTRGFGTGGTIHIVVNNQVGFTISNPHDARSTWYCTDVAKMVEAPIFHVNGDDPEAVLFVTQLALDFRTTFKKDVVIDLVCYRRLGHNEGDEPAATQPLMYQKIKQHPTTRRLYADRLVAEKIITPEGVDLLVNNYRQKLDSGQPLVPMLNGTSHDQSSVDWKSFKGREWTAPAKTNVAALELKQLAQKIETLPAGMVLQPQVAKMMEDRRKMTLGETPLNWGYAETLAYATLLYEGYPIRISGQDAGRGTFAHRHAVLHDFQNDNVYIPLEHLSEKQANFTIIDSLLSEEGVLGFEYGYSSATPNALVIWEAQYGDFVNGAQVVIDQFISSGEQKWGRMCGLTMLLPHAYEGAGPEHSSARLERFLQLCAEHNMQVCVPSTPAQIFHLLRRQVLRPYRKPLIVLTPKSLLRHKLAISSLQELTSGEFHNVIPEIDELKPTEVTRIILCSGKVYYDLLEQRRAKQRKDIAIIRIEQLYPYPESALIEELNRYRKAMDVIWCQEEPKNQGAWYSTHHHLMACLAKGQTLRYVGRKASAAPATGSKMMHKEQQKALIEECLI